MLQRAAVLVVVLGLVACKEPAPKVVVAKNGSAQMTVPGNWKEDPELFKLLVVEYTKYVVARIA